MTKRLLVTALLGTALIGGAAFAQSNQPSSDATTAPAAKASQAGEKLALKGNWRASKLIGLRVYNEANENLGDINELVVDRNGKINAVVIGVGGFLGMGEHDIAVGMDKLKFVEAPARSNAFPTAEGREMTTTTVSPAPERRETTTGATATAPSATTTTTTSTTTGARTTSAPDNDWSPDHAVMSGTKEQLKAMPQFKYSDYN